MNKRAYDMKSADLDRLERELGLVGDDNEDENKIAQSSGGQVISSVRPSDRRAGGCVSSLWLCGIFGGCVPALYSCWLTDWAILNGDRYTGLVPVIIPLMGIQGFTSLLPSLVSTPMR